MVTSHKKRKPRRCSYCRDEGHDRRTCAPLRRDKSKAAEVNRRFIDLVVDDMVERGIGPGALIEFTIPNKETTENEPTPLAMVTGLHWEQLFYRKPGRRTECPTTISGALSGELNSLNMSSIELTTARREHMFTLRS